MNTITRIAVSAALVASAAVGTALPAQAAVTSPAPAGHSAAAARAAAAALTVLPAFTRDASVPGPRTFTASAAQPTARRSTAHGILFHGRGVPGQQVVVRFEYAPGAKRTGVITSGPGTALIADVDSHGNWSGTADLSDARVTRRPDGQKAADFRVIMTDDILGFHKTGQFLGYVPLG